MKNIKAIVKKLLTKYPNTRDNDNLLLMAVYVRINNKLRRDDTPFESFMRDFIDGRYPSSETVRRSRQYIQEHNPELRGNRYKERKELSKEYYAKLRQE